MISPKSVQSVHVPKHPTLTSGDVAQIPEEGMNYHQVHKHDVRLHTCAYELFFEGMGGLPISTLGVDHIYYVADYYGLNPLLINSPACPLHVEYLHLKMY